jgi:hypothetical protein
MREGEERQCQPKAILEAIASSAIILALAPEQKAYEKWLDEVDYNGPWPQVPWMELSDETHAQWRETLLGVKCSGMADT